MMDLADYRDELAEMRREQDALDAEEHARAERIAEGLALLRVCITLHDQRRTRVDAAVARLGEAIDSIVDAREAYVRAGTLLLEAVFLVNRVRGASA